jgi:cytochrome c55X
MLGMLCGGRSSLPGTVTESKNEVLNVFLHGVRIVIVASAVTLLATSVMAETSVPNDDRLKQLVHLVRQDCGSCHGLTLKGGLGPALVPETLDGKPVEGLVATIISGRPGTPMPPFRGILTEDEATWIVERLMTGFPEDGSSLPGTTPEIIK